jgi:hypothetical protein
MKEQNKLEFLTWIAGIMITISFSDLVYNVYLTKNTSSLTYTWIFLILSSKILYFIFGLTNHIKGVYIPSIIIILMSLYIFKVKFLLS